MPDLRSRKKDFRTEMYKKYISTFKMFIGNEDTSDLNSDYEYYRRKYYPLISDFPPETEIIELGCGSGYMLQFLKQQGFRNLYGIDISEEQIKKANDKGINAEVKNIYDFFKTNNKKFDIVFALDFVEHFYKDELLELFSGIKEIMNERGILIIRTPNGQGLFPGRIIYGDLTHLSIFNPDSLTQILKITGFDNIQFYETGPVAKSLVGFIRLVLWKIVKFIFKTMKMIETGTSGSILTQEFICTAQKY